MHDFDPLSTAAAKRLRALPDADAEPYGWEEFRRRASGTAWGPAPRANAAALALRAAAVMMLLAGATALTAWMWGGSARSGHVSAGARPSSQPMASAGGRVARSEPLDVRTRAMEMWLAGQPAEPAMVRVGAYATVAGLEDRIAQLDDLLTTARANGVKSASLSSLQEQRARLFSSLAQVRYAETLVSESSP